MSGNNPDQDPSLPQDPSYVNYTMASVASEQQGQLENLDFLLEALGPAPVNSGERSDSALPQLNFPGTEESPEGAVAALEFMPFPAIPSGPLPPFRRRSGFASSDKLSFFEPVSLKGSNEAQIEAGATSPSLSTYTNMPRRPELQLQPQMPPPPSPHQVVSPSLVRPPNIPSVIQLASSSVSKTSQSGNRPSSRSPHAKGEGSPPITNAPATRGAKTNRQCHVCGDVAKSYHFGGISCDSCKAFFRRAVTHDAYLGFRCAQQQNLVHVPGMSEPKERCQITLSTRKTCQYCRFAKCTQIGMEKKWVLSDEERLAFQRVRVEKKQQKQGSSSKSTEPSTEVIKEATVVVPAVPPPVRSSPKTDLPYKADLEKMVNYMDAKDAAEIKKLVYDFNQSYIDIPYKVSKGPQSRSSVEIIEMFTTILRRMVYFHKKLSSFSKLSLEDQSALLRQGVLEMCMLRSALTYDFKNNRWPCKSGNKDILPHCPVLLVEDMKKLVSPDLYDMQMNFISGIQQLEADETIVTLLTLIVLFYPDRNGLVDSLSVGLVQEKYLDYLQKYTNWRFGPLGPKMYPKFLAKLSDLRQLNDSHNEYNLRLAQREVNQIQEQLSTINLNPYTQWDLVKVDSNKVVGPVEPVSYASGSTGSSSASFPSSSSIGTPQKRKGKSPPNEPSDADQDRLSYLSSNGSTNSSLFQPSFAGVMFSHIVNRQIPILVQNPMATISSEQELASVRSIFAPPGSNKFAKMTQVNGLAGSSIPQYNISSYHDQSQPHAINAVAPASYHSHPHKIQQLCPPHETAVTSGVLDEIDPCSVYKEMLECLGEVKDQNILDQVKKSLSPQTLKQITQAFGFSEGKVSSPFQSPESSTLQTSPVSTTTQGNGSSQYSVGSSEWTHTDESFTQSDYDNQLISGQIQGILQSFGYPNEDTDYMSTEQSPLSIQPLSNQYDYSQNANIPEYYSNAHSHSPSTSTPVFPISVNDNVNIVQAPISPNYNYIHSTTDLNQLLMESSVNYPQAPHPQIQNSNPSYAQVQPTQTQSYFSTSFSTSYQNTNSTNIDLGRSPEEKGEKKYHRK